MHNLNGYLFTDDKIVFSSSETYNKISNFSSSSGHEIISIGGQEIDSGPEFSYNLIPDMTVSVVPTQLFFVLAQKNFVSDNSSIVKGVRRSL